MTAILPPRLVLLLKAVSHSSEGPPFPDLTPALKDLTFATPPEQAAALAHIHRDLWDRGVNQALLDAASRASGLGRPVTVDDEFLEVVDLVRGLAGVAPFTPPFSDPRQRGKVYPRQWETLGQKTRDNLLDFLAGMRGGYSNWMGSILSSDVEHAKFLIGRLGNWSVFFPALNEMIDTVDFGDLSDATVRKIHDDLNEVLSLISDLLGLMLDEQVRDTPLSLHFWNRFPWDEGIPGWLQRLRDRKANDPAARRVPLPLRDRILETIRLGEEGLLTHFGRLTQPLLERKGSGSRSPETAGYLERFSSERHFEWKRLLPTEQGLRYAEVVKQLVTPRPRLDRDEKAIRIVGDILTRLAKTLKRNYESMVVSAFLWSLPRLDRADLVLIVSQLLGLPDE